MGRNNQTPLTPSKGREASVGVSDLRPAPFDTLPDHELTVFLQDGSGAKFQSERVTRMTPRSVVARFVKLGPAEHTVIAFRTAGGAVSGTAREKSTHKIGIIDLRHKKFAKIDVVLDAPPRLELQTATFKDHHGVIVESPAPKVMKHDDGRPAFISPWSDSTTTTVKPEYEHGKPAHFLSRSTTEWHAASYSVGDTVKLELVFKVTVTTPLRTHRLEEVRVFGNGNAMACKKVGLSQTLTNGATLTVEVTAPVDVGNAVKRLGGTALMVATADQHPVDLTPRRHRTNVFATLSAPSGKCKLHTPSSPGFFTDAGATQSITRERLERAVDASAGATDDESAVRRVFGRLRSDRIFYFPTHQYPMAGQANSSGFSPMPTLHHFLWIAMNKPRIAHCLDLAAGLRLLLRMVGVKGKMTVVQLFPWPQWNNAGTVRDLTKDGEPWQASLMKFRHQDTGFKTVFVDENNIANIFEAVLRWEHPVSTAIMLLPVGEATILDGHGPSVSPGPADDRNASTYFEDPSDPKHGKFRLGFHKRNRGFRKPPFDFMTHKTQLLFKFHYGKSTINADDDKKP